MILLLLLVGLGLVVLGADWLVDGASAIARKAGISDFVIGLTIVGFGTSCPELAVSLTGAFHGNADISVGNVIGSNIFNTLFILGVTSLLMPVSVTRANRRRDVPLTIGITVLLIALGMSSTLFGIGKDNSITRMEGSVLLAVFAIYLFYCFKNDAVSDSGDTNKPMRIPIAVLLVFAGLAGLVFGGSLFVDSATTLARSIGVSDRFIAITILAGGTSLPELATCIVAAAKHKDQLAIGNILGSNVFNILFILGCSSLVTPLSFEGMSVVDIIALGISAILPLLWSYTGSKEHIDRWEGAAMVLCYTVYGCYLFCKL